MFSPDQNREELEDDLYQEDEGDSEGSEINSELEFQLYSQLHYSSNAGDMEELKDGQENELSGKGQDTQQREELEITTDGDSELEYTANSKPPSPVNDRKKKVEKQKTRKSDPKGQRVSPSLFEEVIVIDSSPDVISISENDTGDDDEGVCALKGQSFQRLQTSTPAQGTREKERRLEVPVTVVSSSSDSDTEESESISDSDSSSSSDSDGLENWMILGQGKQDGDQSISLNLEGGSDDNTDSEGEGATWSVSEKDKEAQIYNKDKGSRIVVRQIPNRYYTGKNVHCRNCNKTGHLSKNCPDPKKLVPCFLCGTPGHQASECPNKHCNNCGQPGHLYSSCSEKAYWHKQCHRCSMTGHFFDACPEIWRQYHVTTRSGPPVKQQGENKARSPAYCHNCSRKGHFGHACTQQRMFKGVYPITPFINHYDTVEDIKRRQHRIMLKVKEMRKNGNFPVPSHNSPLTPEPPKKKQKISHHRNSYQSQHTPHQTPNNKHRASHIFFNDKGEFRNSTPKAKKFKQQETVGIVKPWKPKRPVPTSRDSVPPTKRVLDEDEDFPRGGGPDGNTEEKKYKKNKRKWRNKVPEEHRERGPGHHLRRRQEATSKKHKGDNKKNRKKQDHWTAGTQTYPADENLFIIKQRKRSRSHQFV